VSDAVLLALIGAIITLGIALTGVVFRMGHQTARIEALEIWRGSIREDMHEISDRIASMSESLERLSTLIEERTQRVRHEDLETPISNRRGRTPNV
jgi:hypothetical protein